MKHILTILIPLHIIFANHIDNKNTQIHTITSNNNRKSLKLDRRATRRKKEKNVQLIQLIELMEKLNVQEQNKTRAVENNNMDTNEKVHKKKQKGQRQSKTECIQRELADLDKMEQKWKLFNAKTTQENRKLDRIIKIRNMIRNYKEQTYRMDYKTSNPN